MEPIPLPDGPLRLLHLGDSYTIGEGIPQEESWPIQLRKRLEETGRNVIEQRIIAATGWTTTDLGNAIKAARVQPGWDFVTICIGVNNQYQGLPLKSFESGLLKLSQTARSLRSTRTAPIIMLSIPDWSVSPFAADRDQASIAIEIDRFNDRVVQVAESMGFPFIDWTSASRQFAGDKTAFAADGLHPGKRQYAVWMDTLARRLGI